MPISNDNKQITTSVEYNYWLESLDTTSLELISQYLIKVPKVYNPTNKITVPYK